MALSDFLTEGATVPAGSAVKALSTSTVVPDWYVNYGMDILANQKALAAQPFQAYTDASGQPIQRFAGFSPTQQAGFEATRQGANVFRPELNVASQQTQNVFGRSGFNAAQPFLSQAASTSGLTTAQPYFNRAEATSGAAAAQPFLGQAAGMSGVTAAQPSLQQGAGYTTGALNTSGLSAAQPYLAQAGQSAADVSAYMNPYTQQVVNRIGELGTRALREQVLPGISDRMVAAGQFGGTRQAELTGRAIRDAVEGITAQQSAALQSGYGQAQQAAQADLARQAQLATTAGGLGTAQQQALLSAGQQMADIGQTYGNLTQAQQAALTNIGQTTGNLTQAQQQMLATLGMNAGNLTQQQQQILAQLGQTSGSLYNADTAAQQNAAQQMAAVAQQRQQQELAGAGALQQVGAQQQALDQQNLDFLRAEWERRQAYPQQQLANMQGALGAVAGAVPKTVEEYGITPNAVPTTSTGQTIASGLAGLGGLLSAIGKL